jgi:hypothetical protein
MKRLLSAALLTLSLTGCGTLTGADAIATTVAAASDVLTGPDSDYKNYLTHCRAEVNAQRDAIKADTEALKAALSDGNEKTQYGATLIMAFKAGQGGPKIGCTAARKKGAVELLLGESDLLRLGVDLYRENRAGARFNRQLEADKEMTRERLSHDREMADRQNDLLTTLSGDKLEQFKAQAEADSQARRDAAEAR